jgi:DNA-binding protein HU-beta
VNKVDLANKIAASSGISKEKATKAIDTAVDSITSALRKGDRVALLGFGTFSVSVRKARNGRNPQTGATIKIAARRIAKFSAGSELSKTVNSFRTARSRKDDAFVSTLAELSNFY